VTLTMRAYLLTDVKINGALTSLTRMALSSAQGQICLYIYAHI